MLTGRFRAALLWTMVIAGLAGCARAPLAGDAGAPAAAPAEAGRPGDDGTTFTRGELRVELKRTSPPAVAAAAKKALGEMNMLKVNAANTNADVTISARTADDKQVEIGIVDKPHSSSLVTIRVGIFGDEATSREILRRLRAQLK